MFNKKPAYPTADDLLDSARHERWQHALDAADRMRDKYGESAVSLASGMKGVYRERTHENPAALPGKASPKPNQKKKDESHRSSDS